MSRSLPSLLTLTAVTLAVSTAGLRASDQDARIIAAAKQSYVFRAHLGREKIVLAAQDGTVTLTGTVKDEYHRTLAEDTVAGLPGVKEVRNQLQVQGEPGLDTPDGRLKAKVQAALLFHRNVSAAHTKVFAKDGLVKLRGEADNQAQKELTTEYVKDVDGVAQVVNEMTVLKRPRRKELKRKIDDASITAQLKAALLLHRGTSALHTKVVTEEGIVTLSGKARSKAERDLCTRIANDLDGVRRVKNLLTVEES
jgi:osmotically-inducible protein OsmY